MTAITLSFKFISIIFLCLFFSRIAICVNTNKRVCKGTAFFLFIQIKPEKTVKRIFFYLSAGLICLFHFFFLPLRPILQK